LLSAIKRSKRLKVKAAETAWSACRRNRREYYWQRRRAPARPAAAL